MANDTGAGKFTRVKPSSHKLPSGPLGRNVVQHPTISLRKSMPSNSRSLRLLLGLFTLIEWAILANLVFFIPIAVIILWVEGLA